MQLPHALVPLAYLRQAPTAQTVWDIRLDISIYYPQTLRRSAQCVDKDTVQGNAVFAQCKIQQILGTVTVSG